VSIAAHSRRRATIDSSRGRAALEAPIALSPVCGITLYVAGGITDAGPMVVVGWILVGLLATAFMHLRSRADERGRLSDTLVVGGFGAVLGGTLAVALGIEVSGLVSVGSWPLAALAALGLLAVDRALRASERSRRLGFARAPGLR
jgi:uncharacterized membrane protein YeaQ/YmgE (transglycosylase-associated protein family)